MSKTSELKDIMQSQDLWLQVYERIMLKDKMPIVDRAEIHEKIITYEYLDLVNQLVEGTYQWSTPEKLLLAKVGTTKKRVVYMYSSIDRVVLTVLFKAMNSVFKDYLEPNCFSYRQGVNTSSAIHYIKEERGNKHLYGVKLDISAYFNSVSREHLLNCIYELFPNSEEEPVLNTILGLYANDDILYKGQPQKEYKSLIPGCALGSFFANYCLRGIDRSFRERNLIYARYSDDIIILDESRELLNRHLEEIKEGIKSVGLTINEKKYVHFEPDEPIEYLGLSLSDKGIDISDNAKKKMKRTIHRWVKKSRKKIEMGESSFEKEAKSLVKRLNWKVYKSYILDPRKFGWGYYVFRYITEPKSLTELDFYLRDQLRYLKTGKHNKANINKLTDEDFMQLGVLSLYDMWDLFHLDFNKYLAVIDLI